MSETVENIIVCVPVTLEYDSSRVSRELLVAEAERGLTKSLLHVSGEYRIEGGEATVSDRRWIPVGERLPDSGVNVLVSIPAAAEETYIASLDEGGMWFSSDPSADGYSLGEDGAPTHWMPRPAPPEVTP